MSLNDIVRQPVQITDADAETLLLDLVSIPSPSRQEGEASRFLVNWMSTHGYDSAYVDGVGNAVGIIGQGEREIVLLGHIDTFGGNLPVRTEARLLYGRGTVDAKGPLCTFAAAAAGAQLPSDVRVVVIGAVEEEISTSRGARHALTCFQPDLCIIGEPSNWDRITLGYKGRLLLDWRWEGALGHSAGQMMTPGECAFAYWEHVRRYVEDRNIGRTGAFHTLSATLQSINTGGDGIHGWAQMIIGFRLPPGVDPQQVASDLLPEDGATTRPYGMELAYVADKDSHLSRALRGAIRAEGGQPAFVHKTGTADMNVVGPVWNCPIVAYGPGDSALDHTPNEHILLDEYQRAIRVLCRALESL